MTDIDESIRDFATFLDLAWPIAMRLAARGSEETFMQDWQQASWESLIEASLDGVVLRIYDGGAEFYPDSSRVFRPATSDLPTHLVVCRPLGGGESATDVLTGSQVQFPASGMPLDSLVSASASIRTLVASPPFDHVVAMLGQSRHVFSLDTVRFFVRPIEPEEV